jgi:hypothetical protein
MTSLEVIIIMIVCKADLTPTLSVVGRFEVHRLCFLRSLKVRLVSLNAFTGAVGIPKKLSLDLTVVHERDACHRFPGAFRYHHLLHFAVLDLHRFIEKEDGDRKSSKASFNGIFR